MFSEVCLIFLLLSSAPVFLQGSTLDDIFYSHYMSIHTDPFKETVITQNRQLHISIKNDVFFLYHPYLTGDVKN